MNSDKPTLYDRLGGVYDIATVVDDFIDREAEWTAFCKDFGHHGQVWRIRQSACEQPLGNWS
jgi:hypothetical protein